MKQFFNIKSAMAAWLMAAAFSFASAEEAPTILTIQPLYEGKINSVSNNGDWAVGDAVSPANSELKAFPRLVNTSTGETTELFSEAEGLQYAPIAAQCVSNDGKTVGGTYYGDPAVWKEGKGWTALPKPGRRFNQGYVSSVTPDGRYAVGCVSVDLFQEYPCMWDLESMTLVDLPGMVNSNPRFLNIVEMSGDPDEWAVGDLNVRLNEISADGNAIIGTVDFCYSEASWLFIYRRDQASWTPIGFKYENGRFTSLGDVGGVIEATFSADGSLIGGICMAGMSDEIPYSCSVADPESFTTYPDGEGYGVWAIGNDGVVYGAVSYSTPPRNWNVKVGNYWYDWKMVAKQLYGIDWMNDITKDELGLSGSVIGVSPDNKKVVASDFAGGRAYVITLPRSMAEICQDVDLLGDYTISPMDGAQFSMLQKVVIDMGRDIDVVGEKNCATVLDADGNPIRNSINFTRQAENDRRVEVIFRNLPLDPGKDYTVVIPAGVVNIAGDAERVNREIRVHYRGREAGPVKPVTFAPDNGASVARINLTTNPVIVTFNATLAPGENPDIRLIQVKDGVEELLYSLSATISGNQVMVYPLSEQRLAEGTDYRIDFGAGSVTDLSGDGANEAFSILYHGSYVPEIDPSSTTIYREDFSNGVYGMMLFEGDHQTPSYEMQGIGFDADNTPWMPVRDEDDQVGNYAAASHSSYEPAGRSDDWMVTPQLYIPDDKATLSFKAQSYRNNKTDRLKVYVWASDDVVTILTQNIIDKIRYDGQLVYNEVLTPGAQEETLEGDWIVNSIDLSAYAGKFIYVAFLNDNQNQSAVFVDDVVVSRAMAAVISIDTPKTLVDVDAEKIRGRFVVTKETGIEGYEIILSDADGNKISSVTSDEVLENGEMCSFVFDDPAPLAKGEVNSFVITFTSGEDAITLKHEIRDLLFETTKRIVVEEMTGTTCQFCPLGIIGVEYLKDLYGDLFIPVIIHSYTGDQLGGAEQAAYSSFLGLAAAPAGSISRRGASSPMYNDGNDYLFTAPDGQTWLQHAEESLSDMSEADVEITSFEIDEVGGKVSVGATVNSAINRGNSNINVFGVIMEDGVFGRQTNGLFNTEAPGLGEWGKGGAYGQSGVAWFYDDVVRGTSAIETAGNYSGFNGRGGYIPSEVKAGEPVSFTFDFSLPSSIKDMDKTKVCLMLIDANTGEYINAAVSGYVTSNAVDGIGADDVQEADVYDLAGRLVMRSATVADLDALEQGIYIRAGKKFIKR